jgi:hypothetical protein
MVGKKFNHPRHGCQRRLPSSMHYVQYCPVFLSLFSFSYYNMISWILYSCPRSRVEHGMETLLRFRPQGKGKKGRADK